jgi:hypothetical protein
MAKRFLAKYIFHSHQARPLDQYDITALRDNFFKKNLARLRTVPADKYLLQGAAP